MPVVTVEVAGERSTATYTIAPPPPPPPPPVASRFALGTHWPSNTPRPAQALKTVESDCSWSAIATAARAAGAGGQVLVRPGTLSGPGAGSAMNGVIQGLDMGTGMKVLIRPRDGYGSVVITTGIPIVAIRGLAFVGFKATGQAVLFRNSSNWAWAWSELNMCRVTANSGVVVENGEWIEPVSRGVLVRGDDRHRFVTADSAAAQIHGVAIRGGYGSPIYRPSGSAAHCDHLQVERQTGGGAIDGVTIQDHVMFGAHSQTLMFAGIPGVTLDNAVILGGPYMERRYPRPAGVDAAVSQPRALNGTAEAALVGDNVVLGGIASTWTFAGSGALKTAADFTDVHSWLDAQHPEPTDADIAHGWVF